jgi:hypothetical protein
VITDFFNTLQRFSDGKNCVAIPMNVRPFRTVRPSPSVSALLRDREGSISPRERLCVSAQCDYAAARTAVPLVLLDGAAECTVIVLCLCLGRMISAPNRRRIEYIAGSSTRLAH